MRALRKIKFISFSISFVLITVMLWVYAGVRVHAENYVAYSKSPVSLAAPPSRFDALLSEIEEVVRQSSSKTKSAPEKGFDGIGKLTALKESLEKEHEKSQDYFYSLQSAIEKKKLPDEILNRHREFVQQYESKYEALLEHLGSIESAHNQTTGFWARLKGTSKKVDWDGVIGKTLAFLEKNTPSPPQSHFDPKNLPHRSLKTDKPIAPKLTSKEWINAFPKESVGAGLAPAGKSSPIKLAATAQTTPADLEETIEVKFTPEIRQLADSLDKNPVKIFNWVRNNIDFIPTWGSIQSAQLCLETRAGNAFDTASLLMALLRYSGIPARYQMGTIEVSMEKAKNWLGGFTDANAAATLAASGGIPSAGTVITGNTITGMRLEHIWVKAYVDYIPSGGAINLVGDTWIDLDSSFKLVTLTNGLDMARFFPDLGAPFRQSVQSAIINPSSGSATGINIAPLEQVLTQSVNQVNDHVNREFPSNTPLENIIGAKRIVSANHSHLVQHLPYRVLARANPLSEIPDNLRHRASFSLTDASGGADFNFSQTLPQLAGKRIALSFTASSIADAGVINALAGTAAQGNLSALSMPAHLIRVAPQLRIDGQIVASGPAVFLGTGKALRTHFYAPTIQTPDFISEVLAGETLAIGLDLQAISTKQLDQISERMASAKNALESGSLNEISTKSIIEDPLTTVVLSWFETVDRFASNTGRLGGLVSLRYPSAGTYSYVLRKRSLFGAVSSVSPAGFALDIGRDLVINIAKDGDTQKEVAFTFFQGANNSTNEKIVPDFVLPMERVSNSGSTTSILAEANRQAIPIYRIGSQNLASVLPLLQLGADENSRIEDAVNSGKEVIVAERPVVANGVSLLAKIVFDPQTGSGAFLISQQFNGYLRFCSGCEGFPPKQDGSPSDAQIECLTGTGLFDTGCIGALNAFVFIAITIIAAGGYELVAALAFDFPLLIPYLEVLIKGILAHRITKVAIGSFGCLTAIHQFLAEDTSPSDLPGLAVKVLALGVCVSGFRN